LVYTFFGTALGTLQMGAAVAEERRDRVGIAKSHSNATSAMNNSPLLELLFKYLVPQSNDQSDPLMQALNR
jgi:hypothetical protein